MAEKTRQDAVGIPFSKEKLFVSDGKDVWFYVPQDGQARKSKAKNLDDMRSPLAFLLGKTKLQKELRGLSLAPDIEPLRNGDVVLRGIPKGFEDQIGEIVLEVNAENRMKPSSDGRLYKIGPLRLHDLCPTWSTQRHAGVQNTVLPGTIRGHVDIDLATTCPAVAAARVAVRRAPAADGECRPVGILVPRSLPRAR